MQDRFKDSARTARDRTQVLAQHLEVLKGEDQWGNYRVWIVEGALGTGKTVGERVTH